MRFRPLPILSVFTLLGLAVLLWLGNWQWQRFQEKLQIESSEQVTQTFTFTPLNLPGVDTPSVYGLAEGAPVWRVYVPARKKSDGMLVFVHWQMFEGTDLQHLTLENLEPRTLEGVMVTPKPAGPFTPPNQPEENLWYLIDLPAFEERLGLDGVAPQVFEPLTVPFVQSTTSTLGPLPRTRVDNPYASPTGGDNLPASRHVGYALTWWGLALGLIAVYLAFHIARGRLTFGQKQS